MYKIMNWSFAKKGLSLLSKYTVYNELNAGIYGSGSEKFCQIRDKDNLSYLW